MVNVTVYSDTNVLVNILTMLVSIINLVVSEIY